MPRTFLINFLKITLSKRQRSLTLHNLAAVEVESDAESAARDVTPSKADPSVQADQELADAVNNNAGAGEEEEDDEDEEEDGEV